jgi:hypothetical protein
MRKSAWPLLCLFAFATGSSLTVEHALSENADGPVYKPRGVIEIGANSAAFKQDPLSEADAAELKVWAAAQPCVYLTSVMDSTWAAAAAD